LKKEEIINSSTENFLKITDNQILSQAVILGFWLQDISKREGDVETSLEFNKDGIGTPFFAGSRFRTYGWKEDISSQEGKDVCMIHTHLKNITFSPNDIIAIKKKHYRYAFVITPEQLHCFYRTKDKILFNQEEYNRVGVALDRDFEKKTGILLTKFMSGEYPSSKLKEIEKQLDKYIEDVREPELMKLLCNIDGLVFAFFDDVQKQTQAKDDYIKQKEFFEKEYQDAKEFIKKYVDRWK